MFHLFKKVSKTTLFPFVTDMHSHFLPGVDDGASDLNVALQLITSMGEMGYKKIITTPHIYSEIYPNSFQTLQPAYEQLNANLQNTQIDLTLHYAAEYFLDEHVDQLVKEGHKLLTVQGNLLLIEIGFIQPPLDLTQKLFSLRIAGYQPIMAHPERYPYWHIDKAKLHDLKDQGILLQLNLLSLTGYYGKPVAEIARYMVKNDLVDLVGTDCHHVKHSQALKKNVGSIVELLQPLLKRDRLLNSSL